MRKNLWFWLTVFLVMAALVASAILLVDYLRPLPVFCEAEGGCGKVRATVFARPLGIPLPAIGIAGVLGIGFALLVRGLGARIMQAILATVGGVVGAVLLVVQVRMGVLCPYCAVVDGASLGLAALSLARARFGWDPPQGRAAPVAAALGMVVAIGLPLAIGFRKRALPSLPVDLPAPIAEEIRRTGRGRVTVVDFVDFECPFCRMTHDQFEPLLAKRKDKVRIARKHVPLRMHAHALDAARAGVCAEVLGKGDAMADALFSAPPEQITPEGCEKLAKEQGLDVERFRSCVRDPATEARIENDKEAFRASKGHGLPTIWIDTTKLEGGQDRATLEETLDAAIRAR